MDAFQNIVPYLTHPLALIGSGLIPPVTQRTGGRLFQILLHYEFVCGVQCTPSAGARRYVVAGKAFRQERAKRIVCGLAHHTCSGIAVMP